ncbi:hypothetical protein CLU79DRAFT_698208 [Phycomyces nitens]|nr:hypothetical protein CLU79DRAFT_698208 [Phycomyces nitens]
MASSTTISNEKIHPLDSTRLWSRVVKTNRISAVHNDTPSPSNEGETKIIHSRIWRNGRSPWSVIFDVTSIAPTHDKCFELLFKQYPTRRLVSFMKEGN